MSFEWCAPNTTVCADTPQNWADFYRLRQQACGIPIPGDNTHAPKPTLRAHIEGSSYYGPEAKPKAPPAARPPRRPREEKRRKHHGPIIFYGYNTCKS